MSQRDDEGRVFSETHLKSFVERVQRLDEQRKSISDDIGEVYAEAKAAGFDKAALKAVVAYLRKDQDAAEEQRAIFDLYVDVVTGRNRTPDQIKRTSGLPDANARPSTALLARARAVTNPSPSVAPLSNPGDGAAADTAASGPMSTGAAEPVLIAPPTPGTGSSNSANEAAQYFGPHPSGRIEPHGNGGLRAVSSLPENDDIPIQLRRNRDGSFVGADA